MLAFVGNVLSHFGQKIQRTEDLVLASRPASQVSAGRGGEALMQTTFSTGLGLQRENRDVAGIGLCWGKPSDGNLRDQFTSELFYGCQLTQFLAITPDVQLIVDPALNPTTDVLAFFGIRLRAAF